MPRQFEATEAILNKLELLWEKIKKKIPKGIVFVTDPEYEDACRAYGIILGALPSIDGRKPTSIPSNLDEIAQSRGASRDGFCLLGSCGRLGEMDKGLLAEFDFSGEALAAFDADNAYIQGFTDGMVFMGLFKMY